MVKFNEPKTRGPFSTHAEEVLRSQLEKEGVPPENVIAVYSELQPCEQPGNYCDRMIKREFPNAAVSYSFPYPSGSEQQREESAQALTDSVKNLDFD